MLNIHHLELFYHVARHGGIAQAVRNMPYGIQQPAISTQIIALEDHLGLVLFRRRPFELTEPGRELLDFIEPFFGRLEEMEGKLQGGAWERLRVGAAQTALRDHLPDVLRELKVRHPRLKLVLRAGYQSELERLLVAGELDIVLTAIDRTIAAGVTSRTLLELPLALLAPKSLKVATAEQILSADRILHPLISIRSEEAAPRLFQQELARRGLAWPTTLETATLELVATYVAEGFGVGLGVMIPGMKLPGQVRVLPLKDFPRLVIGVLTAGKLSPAAQAFSELLCRAAEVLARQDRASREHEAGPRP